MISYVNKVNNGGSQNERGANGNSEFQSLDDVYQKAIDELTEAETMAEVTNLLKIYNDVVLLVDSAFVPKIENEFYRTICNREGIYISDGFAHKILDNQFMVITPKEKIGSLRKVESTNNLDLSVFRVAVYNDYESRDITTSGKTSVLCSNFMESSYYYDPSGCKNDRKIYVATNTSWAISGTNYTPYLTARIWGRRRAGTLCFWYNYETKLNFRDVYYDIKIVINGITNHYILDEGDIPDYYGTVDEEEKQIWDAALTGGPIIWQGGAQPAISNDRVYLQASSQGTNNNWVTIDCTI
jgi:hypothetical protein